ncbi:TonB-dependent receptor [Maribellus comscasis]|uniref:TonB-dependent receptor n=1 Tax=Maribellus comscasis TaxID=2681766 RepID=A0A6I6JUX2_9BACT|nr:TonB-dependent receptor [Maribellus comscasis]QGY43977.1 TonB-dependent receptor [Maribellus comscasis]
MRKLCGVFVAIFILGSAINAQDLYILSGAVTDNDNSVLPGASVVLSSGKKGTVTDADGHFSFSELKAGTYFISVSFVGYKTFRDTLKIRSDQNVHIKLQPSVMTLNEVVVKDNYAQKQKREDSRNIEVVNDRFVKMNLSGSLMKSLERLPGVSTIDIGSGQSKPVIRGLGFNRIVVAENGIKHEGQQWGEDHGLEIDQYAVDRVEVVKGPASLMFGSDAIGGVINIKQLDVPAENSYGGSVDLTGKSNNDLLGTSVDVFARKKALYFTGRVTLLDYGDYRVPTDRVEIYSYKAALYKNFLRNTAGNEQDFHLSFGAIGQQFTTRFYFSDLFSKSGFFANAHGLEPRNVDTALHDRSSRDVQYPYQEVSHLKATNQSEWHGENFNVEMELGFQNNSRKEWSQYVSHGYMPANFPDTMSFDADLERQFDKDVYSGNLKVSFETIESLSLTAGVNSEFQNNDIGGRGFIIPAFTQIAAGTFLYGKYYLSPNSILQAGLRFDYGEINTEEYSDWFPSPVVTDDDTVWSYLQRAPEMTRIFHNISWSVGFNQNWEKVSLKANIGKSFRMPIAKELAANGVNYHRFSYEVGDPDLSAEVSYQLDLGGEYNSGDFAVGLSPFVNYFPNYIYLNPTSEHDRLYGNGNQVFYYMQSEVLRFGGEIHVHYRVFNPLTVGMIGEYVYSEQLSGEKKGFTLPFSPPASLLFNAKYSKENIGWFKSPYFSVDYKLVARQTRIVAPEEKTPGYQVVNLSLGGDVGFRNQKISIAFQIQNLFNRKYFNHTSYYRLINVPEAGRNFVLNINIPFNNNFKK